jgi:dihydrofolate reductase
MIGLIWAQTSDGIIGAGGKIPWRYPGDFKRFKRVTMGSTIVMGRKTWESIGRELPGRTNVVIRSQPIHVPDGHRVIQTSGSPGFCVAQWGITGDVWFIGGRRVYEAAMQFANVIDVTLVPDSVDAFLETDVVRAPTIDEAVWVCDETFAHEDEPKLLRRLFTRRGAP